MKLIEYPDAEMMAIDLAQVLAEDLETALDHQDRVLFVVPGGSTPGPVFDVLCEADLDWSRVDICLSDERWVPEDHARSNTGLLRDRLLVARAAKARLLPLYVPGKTPDLVLDVLEVGIAPLLPISVLLLGMGADMHTASLFPGAPGLESALAPTAPILCAMHPEGQEARVTFSARALDAAVAKHLVITGDDKRAALDKARGLGAKEAPIMSVLSGMDVHWAP